MATPRMAVFRETDRINPLQSALHACSLLKILGLKISLLVHTYWLSHYLLELLVVVSPTIPILGKTVMATGLKIAASASAAVVRTPKYFWHT